MSLPLNTVSQIIIQNCINKINGNPIIPMSTLPLNTIEEQLLYQLYLVIGGGGGSSDHKVLVDGSDTTANYLSNKLALVSLSSSILNSGGDEQFQIDNSTILITRANFIALLGNLQSNRIYCITDSACGSDAVYITATSLSTFDNLVYATNWKNANMTTGISVVATYNLGSDSFSSIYNSAKNIYVQSTNGVTDCLNVLPFDNNNIYNVNIINSTCPTYSITNPALDLLIFDSNIFNAILNLTASPSYTLPLTISNSNLNYCNVTLYSDYSPVSGTSDIATLNGCTVQTETTLILFGSIMDGCTIENGCNITLDADSNWTSCKIGAKKTLTTTAFPAIGKFWEGYYSSFEYVFNPDSSAILSIDAYYNFCGVITVNDATYPIETITGNLTNLYYNITNKDTGNQLTINDHSIGNNVYVHPFETSGNKIDLKNGESVKVISLLDTATTLFVTERRAT